MVPKKFFLMLFIAVLFVACSENDSGEFDKKAEGTPTYLNLSVSLPSLNKLRTLPEDYNPDGTYVGNDSIEVLDVYVVSSNGGVESRRFTGTEIAISGNTVSPTQPFLTTSGSKTIYVVLNSPSPLETTIPSTPIDIGGLATIKTVNSVDYDVITMTGKTPAPVNVLPGIPVQDVVAGIANKFNVEVTRVASRVIVTIANGASRDLEDEGGNVIGSVSDITYSVAQGTNKVYWVGQTDFSTWGSDFVPADLNAYISQANTYYDYSDLTQAEAIPLNPTTLGGYKSLKGKFLFENTHKEGAIDVTEYRKGNTAYVLVRAIFTPLPSAIVDGGSLSNGTFYVGATNGKIYSSMAAAQTPPLGVANQKVATYEGGKMLNYAWLNPDDIVKPLNSPVVRNNIYHVNITGFKRLGYNWNPLYPEEPDTQNPSNPDPKPGPTEPVSPIDPTDPLTPERTYMNVEVTVLDWVVHSYDIEF